MVLVPKMLVFLQTSLAAEVHQAEGHFLLEEEMWNK
jgi:hypothetical protein